MADVVEAVLRGKFVALNAYIRKEERSNINHLSFYLRILKGGVPLSIFEINHIKFSSMKYSYILGISCLYNS